jgi:hypothetical protein
MQTVHVALVVGLLAHHQARVRNVVLGPKEIIAVPLLDPLMAEQHRR